MEWIKKTPNAQNRESDVSTRSVCVVNICANRKGPCSNLCRVHACFPVRAPKCGWYWGQ